MDNFFVAQIPVIVFVIFMIIRMVVAFKRSFVKEIFGLISLIIASFIVMIITFAFRAHFKEYSLIAWSSVVLVILMLVLYKLFETLFTSLKFMDNLDSVNKADRILGPLFAILETGVLIWGVYSIIYVMDSGVLHDIMFSSSKHNILMKFLDEHNYLYTLMSPLRDGVVRVLDVVIKAIDPSYR